MTPAILFSNPILNNNKNYVHLNMMARAIPLLEQTPWIRMYGKFIMSCTKNPQNVRLLTIKKRISPKKDKLNFHLFYKRGV